MLERLPMAPLPHRKWAGVLEAMEVGESWLPPSENWASVRTLMRRYGVRLGRRFSVRKTREGYRVWRIE